MRLNYQPQLSSDQNPGYWPGFRQAGLWSSPPTHVAPAQGSRGAWNDFPALSDEA